MTGNTRNQQQGDLVAQRLSTVINGGSPSNYGKRLSQRYEIYRKLQKAAKQQIDGLRQRLSV